MVRLEFGESWNCVDWLFGDYGVLARVAVRGSRTDQLNPEEVQ